MRQGPRKIAIGGFAATNAKYRQVKPIKEEIFSRLHGKVM